MRIDVTALQRWLILGIGIRLLRAVQTNAVVGDVGDIIRIGDKLGPERGWHQRRQGERIDEDVIVFSGFVMQIIPTGTSSKFSGPEKFELKRNS